MWRYGHAGFTNLAAWNGRLYLIYYLFVNMKSPIEGR